MTVNSHAVDTAAGAHRAGGLGQSAITRPGLVFLPLGIALGPRGLNVLPESLLAFLNPAVSVALATIGALAGLALSRDRRHEPALTNSVVVDTGLTMIALGGCALLAWRAAALPADGLWIVVFSLAVSAAASAPVGGTEYPFASLAGRVSQLGNAIAIVLGAVALSWLQRPSPEGVMAILAQLSAIAVMIGAAGWLLAGQTGDANEQGVFAVGTVFLLGGVAEYQAASALFTGLAAGACWRVAGRAARDRLTRDLEYLQHPLVVLLLLIAGARCHVSATALGLGAGYALCRAAAKLTGGFLLSRLAASGRPLSLGLYLLPPGVLGVAFALNVAATWKDPRASTLLDVLVLGSLISELLAIANAPRERP